MRSSASRKRACSLQTSTRDVHQFNDTASFVWTRITAAVPEAEIADSLVEEYDIDLETARADVTRTVQEFIKLELLEAPQDPRSQK